MTSVSTATAARAPRSAAVSRADEAAMRRAVALARSGLGSTAANPCVGAVVLDAAGQVAGVGRTEPHAACATGRHAEIVALAEAGERARGGTVVTTLEPCNGTGRTGPCTEAIVRAGVRRVVFAVRDPLPAFAGGANRLASAGVEVAGDVFAEDAAALHRPWVVAAGRGSPYVTLKLAATLDGRAAASDGSSQWITGAAARADAHELRGRVDAIVAGSGTVLADDPELTVRGTVEPRTPLRVALDTRRRIPLDARIFAGAAPTYVHRGHDLVALGRTLFDDFDVRHVLVEGGPAVAGAFLAAGLVDEVVAYLAPAFLGAGLNAVVSTAFPTIETVRRMRFTDVATVGHDLRVTAVPTSEER